MTQPLIHGFNIAFEDPNPIQEELGMIALPECFRDIASLAVEFVLTLARGVHDEGALFSPLNTAHD